MGLKEAFGIRPLKHEAAKELVVEINCPRACVRALILDPGNPESPSFVICNRPGWSKENEDYFCIIMGTELCYQPLVASRIRKNSKLQEQRRKGQISFFQAWSL